MFVKLDDVCYLNLYQINRIVVCEASDSFIKDNIPVENGWVVIFLFNNTKYSSESLVKEENNKDGVNRNFTHIQDYYVVDEVFKSKKIAEEWVSSTLGAFLHSNGMRVN